MSADEPRATTRRSWRRGESPMATPNVAAAKPSKVVTFNATSGGRRGEGVRRSVAEVAALEVFAVEGLSDIDRAHGARVDDKAPGRDLPADIGRAWTSRNCTRSRS
jgi:hypothetical protein